MMCKKNKQGWPTWSAPAVTILCVFHFLLGMVAYKWVLWRWF